MWIFQMSITTQPLRTLNLTSASKDFQILFFSRIYDLILLVIIIEE